MFEGWWPTLMDAVQIYLMASAFYYLFRYLKGTRAAQMLLGITSLFIIIFMITTFLELDVLGVVLRWLSIVLLLALLVVFHPELRRALSILGRNTYIQLLQGKIPDKMCADQHQQGHLQCIHPKSPPVRSYHTRIEKAVESGRPGSKPSKCGVRMSLW